MSKALLLMGESGSGKTTSMRNLDPKETYYIDCDKKGLSWKGWRQQYNKENKNYFATDVVDNINKTIIGVNKTRPEIKYVVIDTINGIMVGDEMRRSKEKGYDKWIDLAQCIWDLVDHAYAFRDDLTLIFLAHTQTERDETGYTFTKVKTSGRKLDKICLESKFSIVLVAKKSGDRYIFETQANNSTAKSPMGMFTELEVENDITKIIEAMEEF
jgi:hypothetical protein